MNMRKDAVQIMQASLHAVLPDAAVRRALQAFRQPKGRLVMVALGKAAWQMAHAASDALGNAIEEGIVITKYGHDMGPIPRTVIWQAGHPIPDQNSFDATAAAIELVQPLRQQDTVLLLISGGGSALFEKPLCPPDELTDMTDQLMRCGANIVEINTLRKRISAVKGGRFAQLCAPAQVFSIVLSDIVGDPLDMIASGPAYPDQSTTEQAISIVQKYGLHLSPTILSLLEQPLPHTLNNVETHITGSVRELCTAAAAQCRALGYDPVILTDSLSCEAREAGSFLAAVAQYQARICQAPCAFIAGGETVVHITGTGKGGRNQELALSAARGLSGIPNAVLFSVGSDGTDGPTDAAGGIVDGSTRDTLLAQGIGIEAVLQQNDAYTALDRVGGLIRTGPTGTNVNDVAVLLLRPHP
nr:glycerate kinase [uncultured Agathobaculum sp.]